MLARRPRPGAAPGEPRVPKCQEARARSARMRPGQWAGTELGRMLGARAGYILDMRNTRITGILRRARFFFLTLKRPWTPMNSGLSRYENADRAVPVDREKREL